MSSTAEETMIQTPTEKVTPDNLSPPNYTQQDAIFPPALQPAFKSHPVYKRFHFLLTNTASLQYYIILNKQQSTSLRIIKSVLDKQLRSAMCITHMYMYLKVYVPINIICILAVTSICVWYT